MLSTGKPWVVARGTKCSYLIAIVSLFCMAATIHASAIPKEIIVRKTKTLDTDLVASAESLTGERLNKTKPLFIDVRTPRDFDALHISGAMNIPLHFIKTKTYLKSSPLVLVDQGLSFHRLSPVCRDLNKKGFNARILEGGMRAWCIHDGRITGDRVRQMNYGNISAADFFREKDYSNRIVCDVSYTLSATSRQLMPYATHLPLGGTSKDKTKAAAEFKSAKSGWNTATIIVVNEDGEGYRDVQHAFKQAGLKNVFYLDGGIRAYEKYLDGMVRSWSPRAQRMKTDSPCAKCGDTAMTSQDR